MLAEDLMDQDFLKSTRVHRRTALTRCTKGLILTIVLLVLLLGGLLTLLFVAHYGHQAQQHVDHTTLSALGAAHAAFGARLLTQLLVEAPAADSAANIFVSPTSIAMALAMLSRGADPPGQAEIYAALQLAPLGDEAAVLAAYSTLAPHLTQADAHVTVAVANSVWSRVELKPDYVEALKTSFAADALPLGEAAAVNAWVAQETHGLIPSVLDHVSPDLALLLVDAIYFKAPWQVRFELAATEQEDFQTPDGPKAVAMMQCTREALAYKSTPDYQIVELPYGKGAEFAAFILLPTVGVAPATVLQDLGPDTFTGLGQATGDLSLPRMKLGVSTSLKDALEALGVQLIFGGGLSRMADDASLAVSDVLHQAVVEVNEEGTEAAAATTAPLTRSAPLGPRFRMRVNRPFIFAIRMASTGDLLFLGLITDPHP